MRFSSRAVFVSVLILFVTISLVVKFRRRGNDMLLLKHKDAEIRILRDKAKVKPATQSSVCQNVLVTEDECTILSTTEKKEKLLFPLQYISGATGSGNDWIMWLATINMYTWSREERHAECEVYDRNKRPKEYQMKYVTETHCLFFKSHEPWWLGKNLSNHSARGALLLRHPYDAAFSEYKRQIVKKASGASDWKASNAGLSTDKFIDIKTNKTNGELVEAIKQGTKKWLKHAKYWLKEYTNPVHVLVYNYVKENPAKEIEDVQRFFGYKFNGVNFRRHCCVMANTTNPALKRQPSGVDQHKDMIYSNEVELRERIELTVAEVHELLDRKFPGSHYRITRG